MTELFHELADNAPVMIWRSSLDQMCDYFNKPWLEFTGRSLEQELGIGWVDGVHAEDVELCLTTYRGAFEERKEFSMEYRLRRFDGAYRWVLDNGKPFDREGSFAGYFALLHRHSREKRNRGCQRADGLRIEPPGSQQSRFDKRIDQPDIEDCRDDGRNDADFEFPR